MIPDFPYNMKIRLALCPDFAKSGRNKKKIDPANLIFDCELADAVQGFTTSLSLTF